MDFFASQELARRNTRKLVVLLAITLVCLIASIYALVVVVLNVAEFKGNEKLLVGGWLNWPLLGLVSGLVSAVVGGGSALKIAELRAGGSKVASLLGGRRLQPGSRDQAEQRVMNVVEEMALASGIPVPPVYVLDNEPGINAFAAGHSIDDAVIGVNRGTIEQLSRDELQGVIAHEYSHILNGDMRMSLRMIGILHGIQVIALIGWGIIRSLRYSSSGSSKEKGGGIALILAIGGGLLVLGSVGLFFARLIKASVSRQREYLADASAVQFTRNPAGIADALKTIGVASDHSTVRAGQAELISHMWFARMSGSGMAGLLSTHPPLLARIRKVEPGFNGDFAEWQRERSRRRARPQEEPAGKPKPKKPGFGLPGGPGDRIAGGLPLDPSILIAAIGSPTDDDVVFSRMLVGKVPDRLLEAVRDVYQGCCVAFCFLLEPDGQVRQQQLERIAARHGSGARDDTLTLEPLVRAAEVRWRLPLFEIVQGALTAMSREQYLSFRETVLWLIEVDQQITLFEFFLQNHLLTHLDRHFGLRPGDRVKFERLDQVLPETRLLLSMLARFGKDGGASAATAFAAGVGELPAGLQSQLAFEAGPSKLSDLNASVKRLAAAAPAVRKQVLTAAATTIAHDRQVSVAEAELFRALAESLDCPVPPVIAGAQGPNSPPV